MVILQSDEAEKCFMLLNPLLECIEQEGKELAWLRLRQLFYDMECRLTPHAVDGAGLCACKPELPNLLTGNICSACKLPRN